MVDATIARGGTSVSLPLIETGSGAPVVAIDYGKPSARQQDTGSLDPRHSDFRSGLTNYTLLGRFHGSSAYDDARKLCDLIKSHSGGTDLTLDIPISDIDSNVSVAPAAEQEQACQVVYEPGTKNEVDVDLGLTRVDETLGSGTQDATTPTASGTGPITLAGTSLVSGVEVTRTVGRPNSTMQSVSNQQDPLYIDRRKTAYDAFEISVDYKGPTQAKSLADTFRTLQGRSGLTLDFQGVFGLGSFDVAPDGSGALRNIRPSGHASTSIIPTLNLRVIQT